MTRLWAVTLLMSASGCGHSEPAAAIPPDLSIRLVRGGCEGPCPIYAVSVDSRGAVRWQGDRFVRHIGKATSVVASERLQSLVRRTRELRILSLAPGTHPCLDAPLVTVEVTLAGRSIAVAYCQGDVRPEATRVVEYATLVEQVLVDQAWLGGSQSVPGAGGRVGQWVFRHPARMVTVVPGAATDR